MQIKRANSLSKKNMVIFNSKTQFDKLINQQQFDQNETIVSSNSQPDTSQANKQQIYVPKNGKIPSNSLVSIKHKNQKSIFQHGYFRLREQHNLPNPSIYQPTVSDLEFIKLLKRSFDFKKKFKFNSKAFSDVIQSCQHNFHKHKTISINDPAKNILAYLQFNVSQTLQKSFSKQDLNKFRSLMIQIVNYWKKIKSQRNLFPLLRVYWPKNQITMSKYTFWVPFKTRVLEQNPKKPYISSSLKHLGHTQKENKISKTVKQASSFYNQVKILVQNQMKQFTRFQRQSIKFHKYADLYKLQAPKYLKDILEINKDNKFGYLKQLQQIGKASCFKNPHVRLMYRPRSYKLKLITNYSISYSPIQKQIKILRNYQYTNDDKYPTQYQFTQIYDSKMNTKSYGKRSKKLSIYQIQNKQYKINKKVKLNQFQQ